MTTTKTKRIVSIVLMAIIVLILIMGGVMKLLNSEPEMVMQFLTRAGFGNHITVLGVLELALAAFLLIPKTNRLGFLLACCYFGGALCLEIGGAQFPASAIFLVILWTSMFLRNREMFLMTDTI